MKIVFGSLKDDGLEVVSREGRHYVRYDAGAHAVAWREDEITDAKLQKITQGGESAQKAMLEMQRRLEQSEVTPYLQNWAPRNSNNSVERDVPKLRLGFPSPSAPVAPHVKRYVSQER